MKLNQIKWSVFVLGFSPAATLAQTNSLQLPPIAVAPYILTPPGSADKYVALFNARED